jgi:hypothetical protein
MHAVWLSEAAASLPPATPPPKTPCPNKYQPPRTLALLLLNATSALRNAPVYTLQPCTADNPNNPRYEKGLVAEVSKFLFGEGFAVAGGDQWRVRRRAVGPALHRRAFPLGRGLGGVEARSATDSVGSWGTAGAACRPPIHCCGTLGLLLLAVQSLLVSPFLSVPQGLPGSHAGPCVWRVGAAPEPEAGSGGGLGWVATPSPGRLPLTLFVLPRARCCS